MKKTISITLGGQIYTIEEDGYAILEAYLAKLKRHFARDASAEELMTDIETSIGEKFAEKLGPQKQAISIEDVNEVITVMGKVEEITDGEDDDKTDDMPDKDNRKKLYRDSDDVVVAGVASGLAAYFGIDPLAMRIIFIILGLVNGIGVLLYIILWIAVPSAETNAQKLEMRGKEVNVDEIEQLVKKGKTKKSGGARSILNVPVIIIGAIFGAFRAIFRALGPIISVTTGIFILLGSLMGITMATITAALLSFPTQSSETVAKYLTSDLPINELVGQPLYYVGLGAGYLMAVIPLVLLLILATTLIRRKNSFRLVSVAILVGLWIISAAVGAMAARDIGPWAYNRVQEIQRQEMTTRSFDETGFTAIETDGNLGVTVKQGETFSVRLNGLRRNIDNAVVSQKDGVLKITQSDDDNGPCIFCFSHRPTAEITLPTLNSYSATDVNRVTISGFKNDITLSATNAARIEMSLSGQNVIAALQDVARLNVSGSSTQFIATLSDSSRLEVFELETQSLQLTQNDVSYVVLQGKANNMTADLEDASRLDAEDFDVERATITTRDIARVNASPIQSLEATSSNNSHIELYTNPASSTIRELGNSRIDDPMDNEEDEYGNEY